MEALLGAVRLVEEAIGAHTGLPVQLAEARAQATAQVLEAQRMAAQATRDAAAAMRRADEERARREELLTASHEREARDAMTITQLEETVNELRAALQGAKAELEAELVRHHRHAQALQESMPLPLPRPGPGEPFAR